MASQIEREAEADLVPGTEVMTALDGARSDNQDSIVLIPQPTNDPHDPLVSFIQPLSLSVSSLLLPYSLIPSVWVSGGETIHTFQLFRPF